MSDLLGFAWHALVALVVGVWVLRRLLRLVPAVTVSSGDVGLPEPIRYPPTPRPYGRNENPTPPDEFCTYCRSKLRGWKCHSCGAPAERAQQPNVCPPAPPAPPPAPRSRS